MSSGPENRFLQGVNRCLPASIYRMKNHNQYNAGIADCWYSGAAGDLWVEYKFTTPPKRPATVVDFCSGSDPLIKPLQKQWLEGRHREGRNVGVIIGTPAGGLWLPGISWEGSLPAGERFSKLLSKKELAEIITRITSIQ